MTRLPLVILALVLAQGHVAQASGADRAAPREVRRIDAPRASAVAYDPAGDRLFVARTHRGSVELLPVDRSGEVSAPPVRLPVFRATALAFDPVTERLVVLDPGAGVLLAIPLAADGRPDPAHASQIDPVVLGASRPTALALDPATGALFLLDGVTQTVRVEREVWTGAIAANLEGAPIRTTLDPALVDAAATARGLAFHPTRRTLHLLDGSGHTLHEFSESGRLLGSEDLSGVGLSDAGGIAFAPSGDRTDDPARQSLYVADANARPKRDPVRDERGGIVEVAVGRALVTVPAALTSLPSVVRTIATSQFVPPSPDPSGIAYDPSSDRLVISDGEVDEMPIFAGTNVWETERSGSVLRTSSTMPFSNEPTGVAVDRPGNRYFFSHDNTPQSVFVVDLGGDALFGTLDDAVSSLGTTAFSCSDPEGVGFDGAQQRLFIASGLDAEIFTVTPGTNGIFDGVPPSGDDLVTQFDTEVLGLLDPEGIEYDPDTGTLFIVDANTGMVGETTPDGILLNAFDLSFLGGNLAGVARAPASDLLGGTNLYVVDRAVDNNTDPNENDGKLYEVRVEDVPGSLDLQVSAGPDDAEERPSGAVTTTSGDLELVDDGVLNQKVGIRFSGVTIPQGAPIVDAYLRFKVDEATSGSVSLLVQGQLADDAPTFATNPRNVSSRPRTVASVPWSPPPWTDVGAGGPDQQTPNLAPIVQEIVDQPGWTSGNAMVFIVTGSGTRVADSYEGGAEKAPRLHVSFAPFVCGNAILELGEQCDDGNTVTEACAYGLTGCLVCDAACQEIPGATSFCSDTILDVGNGEQCDDGNTTAGDGCNPTCRISVACSDGVDNDGDSASDFPADPGCSSSGSNKEAPKCQDGLDNDGDGTVDFDGGASLNGGVPLHAPDASCAGIAWKDREKTPTCGLGFEIAPLLAALARRRFRFPQAVV